MKKFWFFFCFLFLKNDLGICAEKIVFQGHDLFQMVYWGDVSFESKNDRIPLGFCDAKITKGKDQAVTKISGRSLDGRNWEIDLGNIGNYTSIDQVEGFSIYLGDLAGNGMTDLVIVYATPYNGFSPPNATFLTILFDKKGYPNPSVFDMYVTEKVGPFECLLRDSQGQAVLAYKSILDRNRSCFVSFYRADDSGWRKIKFGDLKIKGEEKNILWSSCSKKNDNRIPDIAAFDSLDFKRLDSYKMTEGGNDLSFTVVASSGKTKVFDASQGSPTRFYIFENTNGFKFLDSIVYPDFLKQNLDEAIKNELMVHVLTTKKGWYRFIRFSNSFENKK